MEDVQNPEENINDKVSEIIDNHTKWWNAEKFRALFNPRTAAGILKIIIVPNGQPDQYI